MKRFLLLLILFLLAARYPMEARGQTVREEGGGVGAGDLGTGSRPAAIQPLWVGGRTADSVSTALRFDTNGNLLTSQSNSPQTWYFYQPALLNAAFRMGTVASGSQLGSVDSTAVVEVLGANHLYLHITAAPDTAVGCATLWAIQIRRHLDTSTDSLSSWTVLDMNGNVAGAANDMLASSATDTIGTLNYSTTGGVTAANALRPGERLFALPVSSHTPRKQYSIELTSQNGAPLTARYLSIRVRLLGIYANAACTALTAGQGIASMRLDLVGTR